MLLCVTLYRIIPNTTQMNKLAQLGDVIAISKSETITH